MLKKEFEKAGYQVEDIPICQVCGEILEVSDGDEDDGGFYRYFVCVNHDVVRTQWWNTEEADEPVLVNDYNEITMEEE